MKKTNNALLYAFIVCSTVLLISCGGAGDSDKVGQGSGNQTGSDQIPMTNFPSAAEVPDNRYVDNYKILIFGNSHVRSHNLAGVLQDLIKAGRPKATVQKVVASGSTFLDERLESNRDLLLLQSNNWTHVILQGQKYSTTGLYSYPIDASLIWLRAVKAQRATPILFPEHGQQGNDTEGSRVYLLHQSIVAIEPGCVAPVGLAWDNLRPLDPDIELHEADGNHAALAGVFLTALVFYQSITGNNAELLPFQPNIALTEPQQLLLRQVAAATLQQHPACPF